MTRRESILAGAALVVLLLTTIWSSAEFTTQRDSAVAAGQSTANCRALAAAIQSSASLHSSFIIHPSAFSSSLSAATEQAGIPSASISQIAPEPAHPIADTPYEQHPIRLSLHDLTLRQLVTFLHALPCDVDELHLSATGENADTWAADLTVDYLTRATRP
jgi:hypothetical protein